MEIEEHQWRPIVEGMAAFAVTFAEMGDTEDDARSKLVGYMQMRLRIDQRDAARILREAAAAIARFPQPPDESAERLEHGRPIREMLGVPEPSDELAASLRAREWVERLAKDLEVGLQDLE